MSAPATPTASSLPTSGTGGAPDSTRLIFVLITMGLSNVDDLLAYWLHTDKGWIIASALTGLLLAAIVGFIIHYRDELFARLALFGLFAGFAELPADHYAVAVVKILVYPLHGPFIWSSPLYMPFSYIIVMVQLGYLGYWLTQRWGLVWATVAIAVLGGVNVPLYEYLANRAEFWYYHDCHMLFGTVPYITIFTETFFSLVLPFLVSLLPRVSWPVVALLGALEGAWMFVLFYFGFKVTG